MRRLVALMIFTVIAGPYAQDWGLFATISSTMGTNANRMCIGEASRGDIGCPTYAPSISSAGNVSVTGNLQAAQFIGDGSGLTNLSLPSSATDRISTTGIGSGSTLGMVVADRGTISFTLAGVQGAAYLHATAGLVGPAISTTTGNVQALRILNSTAGEAAATPGFSWSGDSNTGMYWVGADQLGLTTGGVQRVLVNSSGLRVAGYVSTTGVIDAGAAIYGFAGDSITAPGYTGSGDTNTGMYWVGADQLGLTTGGVQRVLVNTTGATVTGNFTTTGSITGNTVAGDMVATQAEAEAGTNSDHIMTPLRVLQAITKALSVAPTVPTGAIMAFDLSSCPSGWTEYTPARGRFLRGIDNGAGNDPDGTRAVGNVQGDAFRSHNHPFTDGADWRVNGGTGSSYGFSSTTADSYVGTTNRAGVVGSNGGAETRPKNVAVLYCRKS